MSHHWSIQLVKYSFCWIVVVCTPFVLTPVLVILMFFFFGVRFMELMSEAYTRVFNPRLDIVYSLIKFCAGINIFAGWELWLTVAYKTRVMHHIFLELEVGKWILLYVVFSVFCFLIIFPRSMMGKIWLADANKTIWYMETFRFAVYVAGIYECVLFIGGEAAIMSLAPRWKHHFLLGFETWKLLQQVVLVLLGIALINITSLVITYAVEYFLGDWKHVVYYTKGLRTSANFVFSSNFILIVWTRHFLPKFNHTGAAFDRKMDIITWAFVCLSISSVLWTVKKCIILLWIAHAIYDRFHDKITATAKQFYFLLQLLDATAADPIKNMTPLPRDFWTKIGKMIITEQHEYGSMSAGSDLLQEQTATFHSHELQQLTEVFHIVENQLKEGTTTLATLFANYYMRYDATLIISPEGLQGAIKNIYNIELKSVEAEVLYNHIKQTDESECIDPRNFEKWLVKAYKNCSELSNTIVGAKEVANYLNKLLTGLFLPLIILIWLLITKIATEKAIILLTSPILAATFIFGDTCKSIFHGIMFAFVMHIFDVGDICIVDDIQMEVKLIGLWKTTFQNVETDENIIYQNSTLADKLIIKHNAGLNLNDSVDYCVPIHIWTSTTFYYFKDKIDRFLEDNCRRYQKHDLGVLVTEVGDENVKIVIHFKHKTGDQDMFYSKCRKKHNKNREDLLMKAKEIIDEERKNYKD